MRNEARRNPVPVGKGAAGGDTCHHFPSAPVPSKRGRDLEKKINQAVREALLDHQRAGNPVAVWQNGRVVIVPPSKIPALLLPAMPIRKGE